MRRNSSILSVAAIAACICFSASAAAAATLSGVFNTGASDEEGSPAGTLDVSFGPCADDPEKSCGVIVAIRDPDPDAMGDKMPDGSPIIGFAMVKDLEDEGDGEFRDGKINAVDESLSKGKMVWYGVKIDALDDGRLKVRGCLAFICPRTFYWPPAEASEAAMAVPDVADAGNAGDAADAAE